MTVVTVEKTDRNNKLAEYADAHPELDMRAVGKEFKVTRQRAAQIYEKVRGYQRPAERRLTQSCIARKTQGGRLTDETCATPVPANEGKYCPRHRNKGYRNGIPPSRQ